jgi:signal transduction histidine kinase/DNA-binding response OmpR family regulator
MTRVLVVDDQKIPRVTVSAMLQQAGYEVIAAASGAEGLERAREWRPDVIILDVHMPGMDGFEVVGRLKQAPETAPIPVVFLTAESPSDALVVRGLEMGAYDFLNKGCSRAELLARVAAMARIKRSHDELSAVAGLSEVALHTAVPAELAGRLARQVAGTLRADAALIVLDGGEADGEDGVRAAAGLPAEGPAFHHTIGALLEHVPGGGSGGAGVLEDGPAAAVLAELPFHAAAVATAPRGERRTLLLAVFAHDPGAFRHPDDPALLRRLARQAALALDNAILHARTRQQARELEEQAATLEHAMTERSRFFASMSHELRTPINAILGYGQLLEDGVFGELLPSQQGAATRVVGSARHLLELVNDVLDISKLEAGKMEIFPEPVDLPVLLRDVTTSVELQAAGKGLELVLELPARLPVVTDPGRVRQIVLNLLSNAIKFTDEGSVRLALAAAGESVRICVSDTGPGIAPADQERVFSEFEQTESAAARGGTGLGLPISRRLATLLGGGLSLESEPGRGSTFTLRLPLRCPGAPANGEGGRDDRPGPPATASAPPPPPQAME